MERIIEIENKENVKSHIYVIKNIINNKLYVGQAVTHRLNKSKYRYFGFEGRLKDHISEAINNTKENQCKYLNNSIRKHGSDNFTVKLLETCEIKDADSREKYYIEFLDTLFPNGYNLTKGGKVFCDKNINENILENQINLPKEKRGRDFGYIHTDDTKDKMKEFYKTKENDIDFINKKKECMKKSISKHFDDVKINILSSYNLTLPLNQYIKPVCKKDTQNIYKYIIKIDKRKLEVDENELLENQYNRLLNILEKSYEISKNCNDIPKGK
jgi:group I intron endonuclease